MNLRAPDKLVVGLTGSILSGKSTVLSYFARNGAYTLSADEIVRTLSATQPVKQKMVSWFGSAEPAEVARCIFSDKEACRKLEEYLYPKVLREAANRIKEACAKLVVFEVPLLFEAGWDKLTDLNVLVVGDPRTLDARLQERGLSRAEYERRLRTQMPEADKIRRADILLSNTGSKKELELKVQRLSRAFETIYGQ